MRTHLRPALVSLFMVAASNASAGVITQDGVVFTSTFTGNVLTLGIDAAGRTGGWAGAAAIDALGLKGLGSFGSVVMTSSAGIGWTLSSAELNASGCAGKEKGKADGARLCYSGAALELADNMLFTFTFEGSPTLNAPHLKVHFVDARGGKDGSLLSLYFPWQAETVRAPVDPVVLPPPAVSVPGGDAADSANMPVIAPVGNQSGEVPEPQTLAMIGAGLALMAVARRKRQQA